MPGASPPSAARAATAAYREYFTDRGIFENEVYPGIPELLRELRSMGVSEAEIEFLCKEATL